MIRQKAGSQPVSENPFSNPLLRGRRTNNSNGFSQKNVFVAVIELFL
jgi:hypothetical protein